MKTMKKSLLIIMLLIFLSMAGCGKGKEVEYRRTNEVEKQVMEETNHWNVLHSPLQETYEVVAIDEKNIYGCGYEMGGMRISVVSKETAMLQTTYDIPGATEIKSISVNEKKEIYVFGNREEENTLWKVNPEGEISIIGEIAVENIGLFPYLKNFYMDSNGFIYLWYTMAVPCEEVYENGEPDVYTDLDRIYVKDQEMNTIVYEQVPNSYENALISFAFDEKGIPMLLAKDGEGYYVQRVRTENRAQYEPKRLEKCELDQNSIGTLAFTKRGVLYTNGGTLHLYDLSQSEDTKILELAVAGIYEKDILYLGMRDDTIEIIDNYKGLGQLEYTVIAKGESERSEITIGLMSMDETMADIIASYNRYQNEVTITPVVYVKSYDYDAGYDQLTMDLLQGKAPDLISVDGLDTDILASAGAFADLYSFMQKDKDMGEEDLVSNVIKLYEREGHLYTISPSFHIYTIWGAGSVVEGRKGVTIEEMIEILKKNGGDINSIYGFSADESVLTTLCMRGMDQFIDWEEGSCDFTGKEFQQLLRFAKEYKGKPIESLYQAIQNKEIRLSLGFINSVEDYRLQSELFGEKIECIGYPTVEGSGSAVLYGDSIAIYSQGKQKEEAWRFVKYFVKNGYQGEFFPLVKELYEKVLMESMQPVMVEDEQTGWEEVSKIRYHERDIVSISVTKCDPEDVEAVRKLVDSVSDKAQYHVEIQKIIEEEAGAYLQDQKSLEEVCEIIQNRVQLYLKERK